MHKIIITDWSTHSHSLSHIRTQVFVEEQQVPLHDEWDGLDESATHFLLDYEGKAIGCARLLLETKEGQHHFHIGRVAILKPFRGEGIGQDLVQFIIEHCKQIAPYPIYLHAQLERRDFYARLGFVALGNVFIDAGIPHISMYWKTELNHGGTK